MKSPLEVTYQDVLVSAEKELKRMKDDFPGLVRMERMRADTATRKIALQKELVKILKQHEPSRQLKLGEQSKM